MMTSTDHDERQFAQAINDVQIVPGVAVRIDRGATTPPFEQLEQQITTLIEAGGLTAGDKLPPVRRLAEDLGLAANTVARVYRDLEGAGLLDTRGRSGTFVAGNQVNTQARQAAHDYVARTRALGLDSDTALDLVSRALKR